MGSDYQAKLPILDFSKEDIKPGTSSWSSACMKVRQMLEKYGCFVVEYTRVPLDLHNSVFGVLKELFDLPLETKMQNKYEKPLNGYVGQIPKLPLHESLGIDDAFTLEGMKNFTDLMWPEGNENFRGTVHEYAKLAAELDQIVTRMIFESYGVDKCYDSYINSIFYYLRVLKNKAPDMDKPNLGFVTHTDKSFTTILHQTHVDGLEVETKDGDWITVNMSSPTSFVVMAGDALMAWSNDRIKSPNHRVMVRGNEDRYSLALFTFSNGTVQVPEELIDEEYPLKYKPFEHLGLMRFFLTVEGYQSKCPIKAYCGT